MAVKHWLHKRDRALKTDAIMDIRDQRVILRWVELNMRPLPVIGWDHIAPQVNRGRIGWKLRRKPAEHRPQLTLVQIVKTLLVPLKIGFA
jgi:hypothetical protein